jgi:hypothetical protein
MSSAINVLGGINSAIGSLSDSTNKVLSIGTNISNTVTNWKDTASGTT